MRVLPFLLVGAAILTAGCAAQERKPSGRGDRSVARAPQDQARQEEQAGEQQVDKPGPRKIIYNGRIELVVEDFDQASAKLLDRVAEFQGYIAQSETTGRPGEPRRGNWTVRIPVARFDDFRKTLSDLGELRRSTLDSEDITDRYYDLQAEVINLEAREKALRKLYEEKVAGSKLSDLLEVDRELSNVRGQINLRKGQIQRWDKETAFATLIVEMQDRKSYIPPTSPDFGTSIGRTFQLSLDRLVHAGKVLVLVTVALAPWLAVLAAIALPIYLLFRRNRRSPPPVPPSAPLP